MIDKTITRISIGQIGNFIHDITFFIVLHSTNECVEQIYEFLKCDYGLVIVLNMGYEVKNCRFFLYKKSGFEASMSPIFYRLSKKYGTPAYPKQSEATKCQYFHLDKMLIELLNKKLPNIPIVKVE